MNETQIKRIIVAIIVAFCLLVLAGCNDKSVQESNQSIGKDTITWHEQYDLGMKYLNENKVEEGIKALEDALEIDEKQVETYYALADIYMQSSNYTDTEIILKQGVSNTESAPLKDMLMNLEVSSDSMIVDAYCHTYTNSDGYTFEWHVPKIVLAGPEISAINDEIWAAHDGFVEDSIALAESGISYPVGIYYDWSINGDILSLLIVEENYFDTRPFIYNISILHGTKIPDSVVVSFAGLTMQDYYKKVEQVLGSHFWNECGNLIQGDASEDMVELKKTISQENVKAALPYINSDGQLCVVAHIYPPIMIPDYWTTLNMVDFELVPNYTDSANARPIQVISLEDAQIIAYQYWGVDPEAAAKFGSDINLSVNNPMVESNGKTYYSFEQYGVGTADYVWASQNEDIKCIFIEVKTGECFVSVPN